MSQWFTLVQKEILEMWRNFKWIWVPITFILLGVKEPISNYYMQDILNSIGGLPKGAVIHIPKPSAAEVLIKCLSDYSTIGVLIIVLTSMGLIAAERKSGVAAMILVKPVSYRSFITAKWAGSMLLIWVSFFIGYVTTWYYTGLLFKWIPLADFFQSYFFYGLWLTVILTITVFFSSSVLSSGVAGFLSLAVVMVVSIASSTLSSRLVWSPALLTNYSNDILVSGKISDYVFPASLLSAVCITFLLIFSIVIFREKELTA